MYTDVKIVYNTKKGGKILLNMAMVYIIYKIKRRSWWVFNKYKLRWMTMMLCILVFHLKYFEQEENNKKKMKEKKRKENGENERKAKK